MIEVATTTLLAIHLLAMNVASSAPMAGAGLRWKANRRGGDGPAEKGHVWLERAARQTFVWSLIALGVGALVGGLMLLAPSAGMRAALARFPASAYWFAGAEILFSAACLGGCWGLARRPKLTWLLATATATNLIYHFPPLMGVLGELAANAKWADDETLTRTVLKRLWLRPEILSLWLHFALASVAVGAMAALAVCFRAADSCDANVDDATSRRLARWALGATVLQIPVGIWLLLANDDAARQSMMGDNWLATIGLAGGVWVALGVMQSLAGLAWGGSDRRQTMRTCCLLVLTVLLMSMTLRASRQAGGDGVIGDDTRREASLKR